MTRLDHPSPNWNERPPGVVPDMLVIHYTGMRSAEAALARLRDPAAKVSAHYLIDEIGRVHALVDERARAWHAGVSHWRGRDGLNDVSIGIELANPGHAWGLRPFPDVQMRALEQLARGIVRRWPILPERVLGHADIAPDRKQDPGERFDWRRLAAQGLGLWPARVELRTPDSNRAALLLARIGYRPSRDPVDLALILAAFQRRFRPRRVDGRLDAETMGSLEAVAALPGEEPRPT